MTEEPPLLDVTDLRRAFASGEETTPVLDGLNLTVRAGAFVSVVGKSGSGKSTLLNLIAGIDLPDGGTVRVGGDAMSECTETERTRIRRRRIGMIFQFFNLVPTLTARENIGFPLELLGRPENGRVEKLLERLGIDHRADRYPDTLSGGERQRVAIARALVHEPDLVLADEPTGNLDYENADRVMEAFRELCASEDVAVVMATHSRECASVSDRMLALRSGRLEPS